MKPVQAPSLLDPASCGEDLPHNAARFSELAPRHCSGCADYHIRSAVHRCAGPPKSVFDRPELIRLLRKIIDDASLRSDRMIDIVIAGSADTAVLATCAHAAATLGATILDRCRFTVIDRCETPLLVCAEFAAAHKLHFQARPSDLRSASKPCAADLIVTHSLFRFIDRADQARLLKRLGSWLAPQGRLVFSNRLLLDDDAAEARDEIRKRTAANRAAEEALAKGLLQLAEPVEAILGRLERAITDGAGRPGEFRSLAEVEALIRQSGLAQISLDCLAWEFAITPDDLMRRRRVLAVLGRGHG
jgi:hypothetical protein